MRADKAISPITCRRFITASNSTPAARRSRASPVYLIHGSIKCRGEPQTLLYDNRIKFLSCIYRRRSNSLSRAHAADTLASLRQRVIAHPHLAYPALFQQRREITGANLVFADDTQAVDKIQQFQFFLGHFTGR